MEESLELAAARQREQDTYQHWQSLHQELQNLTIPVDVETEAYETYERAAVERSQLERKQPHAEPMIDEPPQHFCEACLNGHTIAANFHQLVGFVCESHYQECKRIEDGCKNHIYQGIRRTEEHPKAEVYVDGQPLPMTELALRKSPSGFEWGFGGSGPAALAHSILAYEFGEEANEISHQDFKWAVVAELEHTGWTLSSSQIRAAVQALKLPTIASQPNPMH